MTVLVLGSGYLGGAVAARCSDSVHTSRDPGRRPSDRQWLAFDAGQPTTWNALTGLEVDGVIAAFPLSPSHDLDGLWRLVARISPRVVCVGTTSGFGAATEVTDSTPIDSADPRAAAEERWRRHGAMVLHAAGIYGPGRNPLDWVRAGRIANAGKLVNLVHVDDLARACLFSLDRSEPGLRAVLSDGVARRWGEIIAHAVARGWLADPHLPDREDRRSKRVVPRMLLNRGFALEHGDLLAELALLEGN